MDTRTKCINCGADYGLHHYDTSQCPHNGIEETRLDHRQRWDDTVFQEDNTKEIESLRSELQKLKELNAELVEALVKTEKAFQDSCNNYADWLPTQELIHAITLIESLIKKYKES